MSKVDNSTEVQPSPEETNPPVADHQESAEGGQSPAVEELKQALTAKTREAEETFARLQRLAADFDNFKKRKEREREELLLFAGESLVKNLLPVLDNFDRALQSAERHPSFEQFLEGVKLIHRQLYGVLEKEGLSPIEALGQDFDPNLHEAVMQVPAEAGQENKVVGELQKGYLFKGRLIRPTMVQVGAKAE